METDTTIDDIKTFCDNVSDEQDKFVNDFGNFIMEFGNKYNDKYLVCLVVIRISMILLNQERYEYVKIVLLYMTILLNRCIDDVITSFLLFNIGIDEKIH